MRITTFYFSGTGNTRWAVHEFSEIAKEKGHEVAAYSIEEASVGEGAFIRGVLWKSDLIGIAYPIYGADMPPIMKDFLKNLRTVSVASGHGAKPAFTVATMGFVNAYGPLAAGKALRRCGLRLVGAVNIRLANNSSVPGLRVDPAGGAKLAKRRARAGRLLAEMLVALAVGKKYVRGIGPYLIPGMVIRRLIGARLRNNHRSLSVDTRRCTRCLRCVNNCPKRCIEQADGLIRFKPGCTACMRCYNFCPTAAILYHGRFASPEIYKRYHGPQ